MKLSKKIYIASDHGGFYLKEQITRFLLKSHKNVIDLGTNSPEAVDYPDFAEILVKKVKLKDNHFGILLCGTGIGMSMKANRYDDIRAALCTDQEMAALSRKHNNANVLVIGGRTTAPNTAKEIVDIFLKTDFEYGRHELRVNKIVRRE